VGISNPLQGGAFSKPGGVNWAEAKLGKVGIKKETAKSSALMGWLVFIGSFPLSNGLKISNKTHGDRYCKVNARMRQKLPVAKW
jgi:hypothetical protein